MENIKPVLSIGLIVKNEEMHLARCLDSLTALREAIPCQLIITDTGSADNTKEIARRYTDEVYDFLWCDDFAAARNAGLTYAKGQWFMSLDADEWFNDTAELIAFFQSGQYLQYDQASFLIHHYQSIHHQEKAEINWVLRLRRRYAGMQYQGKIHEAIMQKEDARHYWLTHTFLHHDGYAVDGAMIAEKNERNMRMMQQLLNDDGDNVRLLYHMCLQTAGDSALQKTYVEQGYGLVKDEPRHIYHPMFTTLMAAVWKGEQRTEEAIAILEHWLGCKEFLCIFDLDAAFQLGMYYHDLGNYPQALQWLGEFERLFLLPREESFIGPYALYGILVHGREEDLQTARAIKLNCYLRLQDWPQAIIQRHQVDLRKLPDHSWSLCILPLVEILIREKAFNQLVELYQETVEHEQMERQKLLEQLLESHWQEGSCTREEIAEAFAEVEAITNYERLQQMRRAIETGDKVTAAEIVALWQEEKLSPAYGELIYGVLYFGLELTPLVDKLDIMEYPDYFPLLLQQHRLLATALLHYGNRLGEPAICPDKALLFLLYLTERVLLERKHPKAGEDYDLFRLYIRWGQEALQRRYTAEVCCEENLLILPEAYRFFFYSIAVEQAEDGGDFNRFQRNMTRSVAAYPVLGAYCTLWIEEYQRKQDAAAEFHRYNKLLQGKIEQLSGIEGRQLLEEYALVNPREIQWITKQRKRLEEENDNEKEQ